MAYRGEQMKSLPPSVIKALLVQIYENLALLGKDVRDLPANPVLDELALRLAEELNLSSTPVIDRR